MIMAEAGLINDTMGMSLKLGICIQSMFLGQNIEMRFHQQYQKHPNNY
jgi:hypothetical protein